MRVLLGVDVCLSVTHPLQSFNSEGSDLGSAVTHGGCLLVPLQGKYESGHFQTTVRLNWKLSVECTTVHGSIFQGPNGHGDK